MTAEPLPFRLATLVLGPLLAAQGRRVRRDTPRLPEPPGPRAGERGAGPPLALLLVGDSSVAGVGAPSQEEALLGRTLDALAREHRVRFRLVAKSGWTTAAALDALDALVPERIDVAVVGLGVNDVTAGVSLERWLAQQATLRERLAARFGAGRIVVSGLPPMHRFPALPQPLRAWLGARARRHDRALEAALADEPRARFVPLRTFSAAATMGEDGFHPSPSLYREWAARVVAAIADDVVSDDTVADDAVVRESADAREGVGDNSPQRPSGVT